MAAGKKIIRSIFIAYPALKALLRNDLLVFAVTVGMTFPKIFWKS